MNSPNYAVTLVDHHFGDTVITVLSDQAEARRLSYVFDNTRSEVSDYYTVTETDSPTAYATARAYFCSIPNWSTRDAFLAELATLHALEAISDI